MKKRKPFTPEQREKFREIALRRLQDPETRRKMRESAHRRWENQEEREKVRAAALQRWQGDTRESMLENLKDATAKGIAAIKEKWKDRCVNPDHIEAVTKSTNLRRSNSLSGINSRKTHCNNGHPLSGENLRMRGKYRECKICRTATWRRANANQRRKRQPSDAQ